MGYRDGYRGFYRDYYRVPFLLSPTEHLENEDALNMPAVPTCGHVEPLCTLDRRVASSSVV